jgi:hypothetical protein
MQTISILSKRKIKLVHRFGKNESFPEVFDSHIQIQQKHKTCLFLKFSGKRNTLTDPRYSHELYDRINTKHQTILTSKAIPVPS